MSTQTKPKPLTQDQASRLLRNRLGAMPRPTGRPGWTGSELRSLLKSWGVARRRRGTVLQRMVVRGQLRRDRLDEPLDIDDRQVHFLYNLPENNDAPRPGTTA